MRGDPQIQAINPKGRPGLPVPIRGTDITMPFNQTIPQAFRQVAARHPGKTAVVYLGDRFSYARVDQLSDRFALALVRAGVCPDSKVVLYLPNSLGWIVAWLGVLKAGAVAVPITPIYTAADLIYIANDTGAEAVVCMDRNYGHVVQAMEETSLELAVVTGLADLLPIWKRVIGYVADIVPKGKAARSDNSVRINKFLAGGRGELPEPDADPDRVAEILYTGGTTRHPKGVPVTHRLLGGCCEEQLLTPAPLFDPAENVLLGSAPMYHILGQTCGLGTLFTYGGTILSLPRINLDAVLDAAQRNRATTLIGVPALYRMILEHDRLDLYDLSSLKFCFSGGDVLPEEIAQRWRERFGRPIYVGYGATETIGGISMCPTDQESPPGSMGPVLPSKKVRLMKAGTMEEVEPGSPGELLVHSDPMVEAYWNKPEETDRSFVEIEGLRFYRTGDVVVMDHEGRLYFHDRTVDTIKHKGYRVSASEIECVLQDHPAVVDACVVGLPDERVGERIKAFVVLKKDVKGVTGYELIAHCKKQLAGYKIPQYIEFRDMLPKSKVGKLLRREIRAEEEARQGG